MNYATMADMANYQTQWNILFIVCFVPACILAWMHHRTTSTPTKPTATRPLFWLILLPLAFVLRFALLNEPVWYDETFTHALISASWRDFMPLVLADVHPPGYYAILKLFGSLFSYDIIALRAPALLFGLLLIPAMYRLTFNLWKNPASARAVAIVTAFYPAAIHYSTEARYPTLLALVVIVAVLALQEERPRLFVATLLVLPLLHTYGTLYACLLVCAKLIISKRVLNVALFAPAFVWLPGIYLQTQHVADSFWIQTVNPFWFIVDMTTSRSASNVQMVIIAMIAALTVAAIGLHNLRYTETKNRVYFAAIISTPLIIALVSFWQDITLARAMFAPALLLTALAAHKPTYTAAIVFVCLFGVTGLYLAPRDKYSDLSRYCLPNQTTYVTETALAIKTAYHADNVHVWEDGNNRHQVLPAHAIERMGITITNYNKLDGDVCTIARADYFTTAEDAEEINRIIADSRGGHIIEAHELYKYYVIYKDISE